MSYREGVALVVRLLQNGEIDAANDIWNKVVEDAACLCAALHLFFDMDRDTCAGFAHVFGECLYRDVLQLRFESDPRVN